MFNFDLSTPAYRVERERLILWQKNHNCILDNVRTAIGGRETFSFTPTSVGVVVKISCACGEEKDLSDYDSW